MQLENESIMFNKVRIIGRLMNTPEKEFIKGQTKKLFTRFLVKTQYQKRTTDVPFIMFGQQVDIVCTKFRKGDVVAIEAQICTRDRPNNYMMIDFVVEEILLITKSKLEHIEEDKFRTIVMQYDKDIITDRMRRKRK